MNHQNTKLPKPWDKSGGQRSDAALTLPSTSRGEVKSSVPIYRHVTVTTNMKHLLDEFKGLYEERLRRLELETTDTQEEMLRMKVCVLQSYVNDLAEQNQVLVQTVEELEKEADHKVSRLEMKLCTSDDIINDLGQQRKTLEQSLSVFCSENRDLRSNLNSLTQLIQRSGHTHIMDVSGVKLGTVSSEGIVGPNNTLIPCPEAPVRAELENLKSQLKTRDQVICSLEEEINTVQRENAQLKTQGSKVSDELVYLQSQVSCLQQLQRDKVKEIAEKDIAMAKLHTHLQLLLQEGADTHTQLSELKERVKELQEEVRRKGEERRATEECWMQKERQREEEEERREQEQLKKKEMERQRVEERVKRVEEEKRREQEWRKKFEEEREAHTQAVTQWAEEKAAILNAELESSRAVAERQKREMLELQQKAGSLLCELQAQEGRLCEAQRELRLRGEETLQLHGQLEESNTAYTLTIQQAEAKMASLRSELSTSFERRMEEKEETVRQLTEELHGLKEQVGDLQQTLRGQSKDLDELQHHYQDSLEDNACLRARLNAHTLSTHSQHHIFTSELSTAEGQLHAMKKQLQDRQKELESATLKIVSLESSLREAEQSCVSAQTEVHNHSLLLEEMGRELERLTLAERDAALQVKVREERVRHLEQDVVALQATQDSLKRPLAMKEQHTQRLTQDNTQLRENMAVLQTKHQTSECMLSDVRESLDQVKTSLSQETQQKQRIQDQLHNANQEVERLRKEVTHIRRAADKKIQRREAKMSALVKELTERKKLYSDCQKELLSRQGVLERLRVERDELRGQMEESSRQWDSLNQTKNKLEADLAQSHHKNHTAHLEVRSRDQLILQLRSEMKAAEQKHQGTQEEVSALEAEVTHLNQKVRGHQEEVCQLREKVKEGEGLTDQTEKERQQLHNQLSISQQQLKSQAEFIDRLNSDLEAVEQAHKVDAERWSQRNFLLHSQLEQTNSDLSQSQTRLREQESEIQKLKEILNQAKVGQQEAMQKVEVFERLMKKHEVQMELLAQQLKRAQEGLEGANQRAQEQEETAAIFKHKYSVAMEKVQKLQGQVENLEEELRYSQQQIRDSQVATTEVKAELAELEGRYQEKVGQWESSVEALDQLTDELQANQDLLIESREKLGHCKGLTATLQEQVDTLKQQKLLFESDLRLYQQTHSHTDEEYLGLLRHRQQLQRRCTDQTERLAECERTVLQMKMELQRQSQEKAGLEQTLAASHHTLLANRSQLEQEVTSLHQEVTRLQLELADAHNDNTQRERMLHMRDALLQQSEEDLKEAKQEAERRSREVKEKKEEVERLQEEVQREEAEKRSTFRENQRLRSHVRQLSQELEELGTRHRHTAEELAARVEEARRMAGCLSDGKLAEEKRRTVVERLEREVSELREALQQALDQKLNAQREKQDTQEQVDSLRLELEGTRSDNTQLRHESQLVMANVSRWITEQKASSESLAAQIKAQNKVLVIITDEKEHLQEANDMLKEELKKLKEVAEEKEREMERFTIQSQGRDRQQEDERKQRQSCVALNLSKIEDMQARLRSNLEAIGILNQQLIDLGSENNQLRGQLEEERAARRRVESLLPPPPPPPPPPTHCFPVHLPLTTLPPLSMSPPSSLHPCCPPSAGPVPGDNNRILSRAELSGSGPSRQHESQALSEAFWRRLAGEAGSLSASIEDVWSDRLRGDLAK